MCFQVRNALALGVVAAAVEGFAGAGPLAGGAFHHGSAALRAEDGDPIDCRLLGGVRVRPHPLSLEITDCDFKIRFLSFLTSRFDSSLVCAFRLMRRLRRESARSRAS